MNEWDDLRNHLMRGGQFGHYWTNHNNKKHTVWWDTAMPTPIPTKGNIYFGVHPVTEIPTLNSLGKPTPPEHVRSRIAIVAAVNCLFAEYDAKDFDGNKEATLEHIRTLRPLPSAVVDSGGGYHAYWLLDEPVIIDSDHRRKLLQHLQAAWVDRMGGDDGAKDLARVLRVPGTFNVKPVYAPDFPQVRVLHLDISHLYILDDLATLLPPMPKATSNGHYVAPSNGHKGDGEHWLQKYINQSGGRNRRGTLLATQLRDDGLTQSEAEGVMLRFASAVTGQETHPYPDKEALKTLQWAYAQTARRPATSMNKSNFRIVESDSEKPERANGDGRKNLLSYEPTDEGNAEAVWSLHKDRFRYVTEWGWLYYTGTHWEQKGAIEQLGFSVVQVLRERRLQAVKSEYEAMITASKTSTARINACIASLQKHAFATVVEFDQQPHLLNCSNGVIDLISGHLVPHADCPELFTYCIPTAYDPDANYTTWAEWLGEMVAGGGEVVDFLQMAVGYSITGETREECFFYIYGVTRSGKGTFTETLMAVLGDTLSVEIDFKTFAESKGNPDAQNFALAPLKPARIVFASEPNQYDMLNAGKMKSLTGGNHIRCAFKGKDHFSYKPRFKIWLTSNPAPKSDPDDDAFWGRMRVLNFPHSHLGKEDKTLKAKMSSKAMREAILCWAVEGAHMWYATERGLITPASVALMTQQTREELDTVQRWLSECTIKDDTDAFVTNKDIRTSYDQWCHDNGHPPKGAQKFNTSLRNKGFKEVKTRVARGWSGFKVVTL